MTTDEGKELADTYNIRFIESSAKDNANVEEAFTLMTKEIKSRVVHTEAKKPTQTTSTKLNHNTKSIKKKKDGCC